MRAAQPVISGLEVLSAAFLDVLSAALQDPAVTSVSLRGDYAAVTILQELVHAQQARGEPKLEINALTDFRVTEDRAEISFSYEGLAPGWLHVEMPSNFGASVKWLCENWHTFKATRFILSLRNEGPIRGFDHLSSDGYWLYTRKARRSAMKKTSVRSILSDDL